VCVLAILICTDTASKHEVHFLYRGHRWLSTSPRDRHRAGSSCKLCTLEGRLSQHQSNSKRAVESVPCCCGVDGGHREGAHVLAEAVFHSQIRTPRTHLQHHAVAALLQ